MMMPMSHYITPAAGGFDMTAGSPGFGAFGWVEPGSISEGNLASFGSATGDLSADGGTVTEVYFIGPSFGNLHYLVIFGGSQSATNINIDGTDYTVTFGAISSGYDYYTFGPSTSLFADGVTYSIEVT